VLPTSDALSAAKVLAGGGTMTISPPAMPLPT
jgi:hypothetical protein